MMKNLLLSLVFAFFLTQTAIAEKQSESNPKRQILIKVKQSDYLHHGDRQATEHVISKIEHYSEDKSGNVLDLGSNLGAAAHDFFKSGYKKVWGVDRDSALVKYSAKKYPHISFFQSNNVYITKRFKRDFFSTIYAFDVFSEEHDKEAAVKAITKVAKDGALIAVIDYSKLKEYQLMNKKDIPEILRGVSGRIIYPLESESFEKLLTDNGWEILEKEDMTPAYIKYNEEALNRVLSDRKKLSKEFKQKDIESLANMLNRRLYNLKTGHLGGVFILAKKTSS